MTRNEIEEMPAKRLNIMIAEKVLGWIAWKERRGGNEYIVFQKPGEREPYRRTQNWENAAKNYQEVDFSAIDNHNHIVTGIKDWSHNMNEAFEVVETMGDKGWMLYKLAHTLKEGRIVGYACILLNIESGASREGKSHSAARAIAIAALSAMEASHETEA